MKKKIIFLGTLAFLLAFSCKKDEPKPEEKKVETPPVKKDTIIPVKYIQGIRLYNQGNSASSTTNFRFYDITTGTYSNDVTSNIDLAYVYKKSSTSLHILGSSKSSSVRGYFLGVGSSTNQSQTDFYKVSYSNVAIFDTIKDSKSVSKLFNSYTQLSELDGEIGSDGFGWENEQILAFRLSNNGKRGFIKLTSDPTAFLEGSVLVGGRMVLDIKMEP